MNVNDKQMPIEYDNLLRDFQELRKEKDALYEEILEKERVICNKFCYECELERRIKELEELVYELNDRNTQLKAYMLDYKETK